MRMILRVTVLVIKMLHKSQIGFNCSLDYVIIVSEVFPFPLLSIYLFFLLERDRGREKSIPI